MPKPDWTPDEPRQIEAPKTIGGLPVPTQDELDSAKINEDLDRQAGDDNPTRAAAAVALRISGASWTQIARTLEYASAFRARQVVERAIAESAESEDDHTQLRWVTARRIERLLNGVWRKATDENQPDQLPYARFALAAIDRHARLHGLDAPQQMVVYTPDQQEVDRWVKAMAAQVRSATAPVEAEVIDVDWTDVSNDDGEPGT